MNQKLLIAIVALASQFIVKAQVFDVDTIQYRGDINKYINIVILGDGYTSGQQTDFINNSKTMSSYFFSQSPWKEYSSYCNVFAIKVVSAETGARHPKTASDCGSSGVPVPVSNPNTYFGSTFDYNGIHRLVVPTKTINISNVLASNFPSYDQVLIIVNSVYYGGSGGTYATSTIEKNSGEILAHEVGHSFGKLADEYWAGASYAAEKANMTKQSNATLVKWKNWINAGTGIGVYPHSTDPSWYKPHQSCKMQFLNQPFCSVCKEATIEVIHGKVNPVVAYTPNKGVVNTANTIIDFKLTELMKPAPNTLKIEWKLNGSLVALNKDSIKVNQNSLVAGTNKLVATVVDTNVLLRVTNHASVHVSTVEWSIQKTITGIDVSSMADKISFSMYPNPSKDYIDVEMESDNAREMDMEIISADGSYREKTRGDHYGRAQRVNISHLSSGAYTLVLRSGEVLHKAIFVKE